MSSSDEGGSGGGNGNDRSNDTIKYKGIRRRKWGKWVTEIRVPGTQERIWLGSYSTPEGAAGAHDVAAYCLRGMSYLHKLNFPEQLPPTARAGLSPQEIQKAASDAGMAIDARFALMKQPNDDGSSNSYGCGSVSSVAAMSLRPTEYGYNHQHYQEYGYNHQHYHEHQNQMIVGEGEPLSISVDDYL